MAGILIVDDDPEFVDMTRMVLEAHGHKVRSAGSSGEGLRAVEVERPDLIILDVMMESLGAGFSAAQQLRSGRFKDIPLLMVTGISGQTGFEFDPAKDQDFMPVDGYLEKPVKSKDLIEQVDKLLGK